MGMPNNNLQGSLKRCIGGNSDAASRDQCLLELAEKLRPFMTTGITIGNVQVPRTEPMFIPLVELDLVVPGLVDVKNELSNIMVKGLSKFVLKSVNTEKQGNNGLIHTNISVPALNIVGNAAVDGELLGVEFTKQTNSGSLQADLENVDVSLTLRLVNSNGRLIIREDPEMKTNIGDMKIKFGEGVFPKQLGKTVETFFNDKKNNKKFIEDFKPQIQKQIGSLAKNVYNAAVQDIDASVFGL